VATLPASPGSPNGLSTGTGPPVSCPGTRLPPTTNMATPATVPATTHRQRRDRSRPSGSSRNGRVTPKAMAGAQPASLSTTASRPARVSGRWSRTSVSSQGSKGMTRAQASPAAAYSQPIGLAGRRRHRTSPTVA
jgi:hypothetical protein